jgi:Protein of unknown function (DUF2637)
MEKARDPACSSDLWIRLVTVISVVLLAVIAAVVSFGHMRELALRHGEARWSANLIRSAWMGWSLQHPCLSCLPAR